MDIICLAYQQERMRIVHVRIEEYTQKNNISKVDLTVAVLNSKNASKNLVDKAVERYTRMAASLQKLYFARISSVESVTKIAENMDTNILEKVSGTGYAAKQRLEKIKEDRKEIYV